MASREEQKAKARAEREAAQSADDAAAERRKRTAYLAGGIGLIALIVVVALVLVSQAGDDSDKTAAIDFSEIPQQGITLGDPDAPVTVVEFADLQCPFCRDFAVDDLPGIVTDYVEPGEVKMEMRLLAFIGPESEAGRSVAAGAAEQNLIWPFTENVYNNQGTEGSGYMTTEFLSEQASAVDGLDVQAALDADGSPEAQKYAAESDQEAEEAGVSSTPSFAVTADGGDTQVVDAAGLRDAIDDALSQADSGQ